MNVNIIIARYQEDISWSDQYSDYRTIYNKGDTLNCESTSLPLIGREAYTYMYHVVNNYNNLADHTVFSQGHPFDHAPSFHEVVDNLLINGQQENFVWLSTRLIDSSLNENKDNYLYGYEMNFEDNFFKIFKDKKVKHSFTFGAGAEFIVSKESIQKRTLDFYRNILSLIEEENDINGPLPYQLERYWRLIFDYDYAYDRNV